jgi:abortive infection bacteriophage resistance protein
MSRTRDRLRQKNCAQLDSLEELGLLIDDRAKALEIIQHLNIYRLKPYWTPFIVDQASPKVALARSLAV